MWQIDYNQILQESAPAYYGSLISDQVGRSPRLECQAQTALMLGYM